MLSGALAGIFATGSTYPLVCPPSFCACVLTRPRWLIIIFPRRACACVSCVCGVSHVSCLQDLVRTRLAAQTASAKYKGLMDATRTIVKEEGVAGLYKGLWTSCLVSPQSLFFFLFIFSSYSLIDIILFYKISII